MLKLFVQATCCFGVFRSGSMSVDNIDALNRSIGVGMPCGRMGIRREAVDG